jgi:hypothetical protein
METDNYFYTDKKGKRFLDVFKSHLELSETPQIELFANQNLRLYQILLTDKKIMDSQIFRPGKAFKIPIVSLQ